MKKPGVFLSRARLVSLLLSQAVPPGPAATQLVRTSHAPPACPLVVGVVTCCWCCRCFIHSLRFTSLHFTSPRLLRFQGVRGGGGAASAVVDLDALHPLEAVVGAPPGFPVGVLPAEARVAVAALLWFVSFECFEFGCMWGVRLVERGHREVFRRFLFYGTI